MSALAVTTPSANVHEFTTELIVRRRSTPAEGVVVLDLAHPENEDLPRWEPGAHIDLVLDDGLTRQYSLCGDPRDSGVWRIGVLLDPNSRGGSRFVHENINEGATVRVRGPRNHFPLVDAPRYRFIAGVSASPRSSRCSRPYSARAGTGHCFMAAGPGPPWHSWTTLPGAT